MEILEQIGIDPLMISPIIGLIGISLAIFFYLRNKRDKKPLYIFDSTTIISEDISQLNKIKISYDNKDLKNLVLSKLALWNGGRITINDSDVVNLDKIRVEIDKSVKVYDVIKVHENEPTNNFKFKFEESDNSIAVSFDYIDFQNGCILGIYHSRSKLKDIVIKGKIKGYGYFREGVFPRVNLQINTRILKFQITDRLVSIFWFSVSLHPIYRLVSGRGLFYIIPFIIFFLGGIYYWNNKSKVIPNKLFQEY